MKYDLWQVIELDDVKLKASIREEFLPHEIYTRQQLIDCAVDNFGPEDVYSDETLERWALTHGFVKET